MRRNQFEQQFEDSEANFSEAAAERMDERMQGEPMQLLKVLRSGNIELNEQVLNLIASYPAEVGFVSIVGKMRTGKSCLLNRILGLTGKGFKVDATVSSCTQGIWIWSQPVFNDSLNCFVFFMDTEGADSLEKDAQNDAKIFTLSLLISSYLVYNSVGSIDQRSISELEMVTALSQQVRTDQRLSQRQSSEQLYKYMPKFMWILRDMTLKPEDDHGRRITPTQYLQNSLTKQGGGEARQIRKSLLTYFKNRQCMTMVRPVGDESQLQRLDTIPDHALRRQFIEAVALLRQKLVKGCGAKSFGGQPVTGPAMSDLIEQFVGSFNSGRIPAIKSVWQQIAEDEGAKAYNMAVVKYEQIFQQEFPDDAPRNQQQIRHSLIKLRQETMKEFNENISNKKQFEDMRLKLKKLIDDKEQNILEINKNVCEARNNELLMALAGKLKTKVQSNAYVGKKEEMQRDFDEIITKYNQQAKGPNKGQILSEFVLTMNPIIFKSEDDVNKKKEEDNLDKIKKNQYEKMLQLEKKKKQTLEKQLQQSRKAEAAANAALKKAEIENKRKKQSQGCCSGDKCLIM